MFVLHFAFCLSAHFLFNFYFRVLFFLLFVRFLFCCIFFISRVFGFLWGGVPFYSNPSLLKESRSLSCQEVDFASPKFIISVVHNSAGPSELHNYSCYQI